MSFHEMRYPETEEIVTPQDEVSLGTFLQVSRGE